jgi:hypothetical protein
VAIGCNPVYIEGTSAANRRIASEICGDGKQRALAAAVRAPTARWHCDQYGLDSLPITGKSEAIYIIDDGRGCRGGDGLE